MPLELSGNESLGDDDTLFIMLRAHESWDCLINGPLRNLGPLHLLRVLLGGESVKNMCVCDMTSFVLFHFCCCVALITSVRTKNAEVDIKKIGNTFSSLDEAIPT